MISIDIYQEVKLPDGLEGAACAQAVLLDRRKLVV